MMASMYTAYCEAARDDVVAHHGALRAIDTLMYFEEKSKAHERQTCTCFVHNWPAAQFFCVSFHLRHVRRELNELISQQPHI